LPSLAAQAMSAVALSISVQQNSYDQSTLSIDSLSEVQAGVLRARKKVFRDTASYICRTAARSHSFKI
jgi:hypothetical protein